MVVIVVLVVVDAVLVFVAVVAAATVAIAVVVALTVIAAALVLVSLTRILFSSYLLLQARHTSPLPYFLALYSPLLRYDK